VQKIIVEILIMMQL